MSTGWLTLAQYEDMSPYAGALQLSRGPNPWDLGTMNSEIFEKLALQLSQQWIQIERDTHGKVTAVLSTPIIDTHVHGRWGVAPGYRGDILMRLAQTHLTENVDGLLYMPNTMGHLAVDNEWNPYQPHLPTGHITTVAQYGVYRSLLMASDIHGRKHVLTVSLTPELTNDTLSLLRTRDDFGWVKYYPAGATTNSEWWNTHIDLKDSRILYMADHWIPFHIHPETSIILWPDGYPARWLASNAEREFVSSVEQLCQKFPNLPIVMEHISTRESVTLMEKNYPNLSATVTTQHLLLCEGDVNTGGGVMLHNGVCRPTVKGSDDLRAIQQLVLSGNTQVMMGTDSAPHFSHISPEVRDRLGITRSIKQDGCCANGVISAPDVVRMMWQFFEENGKLEHFAGFMGRNAIKIFPQVWWNTRATPRVLISAVSTIAERLTLPGDEDISLIPMLAGHRLRYTLNAC